MRLIKKLKTFFGPVEDTEAYDGSSSLEGIIAAQKEREAEERKRRREAERQRMEELKKYRADRTRRREEANEKAKRTRARLELRLRFCGNEIAIHEEFTGGLEGASVPEQLHARGFIVDAKTKAEEFEKDLKKEIVTIGFTTDDGTFYPPHALLRIDRVKFDVWEVPEEAKTTPAHLMGRVENPDAVAWEKPAEEVLQQASLDVGEAD